MGVKFIHCFVFLVGFLLSSGTFANDFPSHRLLIPVSDPESLDTMPQLDVITPMTTVPTINPTTPTTTTPTYSNPTPATTPTNPVTSPYTTPMTGTPSSSSGQSWCVASQTASQNALQVAIDYACGYGGSDCSAIQQGGSCFNPDTLRDHASYAFNSYYQRNPVPTSCDFGGTAVIANTDPSSSSCRYALSSTSSSTTSPTGSTVLGSSSPDYDGTISNSMNVSPSFALMILLLSLVYLKVYE